MGLQPPERSFGLRSAGSAHHVVDGFAGSLRPGRSARVWRERSLGGAAGLWVAQVLEHVGHAGVPQSVEKAIQTPPANEGPRTPDLGGRASTEEVGRALAGAVGEVRAPIREAEVSKEPAPEAPEEAIDIFEEFDLRPVVNAAGGASRIGGALPDPTVVQAMSEASGRSLLPLEVQAEASRRIASVTGAEAGIVTTGASASLTLSAAAVLAGLDVERMDRLPETGGIPNELLIARPHRNGYDRAFLLAGARLIEVGMDERSAGAGGRRTESWEYAAAAGDRTIGIVYVAGASGAPPLEEVLEVARDAGLPLVVDAAGVAPPVHRVRHLLAAGADLVAVSGGKALQAPPATGLLCGRSDLVASAAVQCLDTDEHFELWDPPADFIPRGRLRALPRQGVGRGFKVSPAQVVGFLVALERQRRGEADGESQERLRLLEFLTDGLAQLPIRTEIVPSGAEGCATLQLRLVPETGLSALEASRQLRLGEPPVYVGEKYLEAEVLVVDPLNLTEADHDVVLSRLREVLEGG